MRGESTPFYLWNRGAHRRIAEHLPDVKLIAVVRDPIDRAYSNWMHLWSDGLEPVSDFEKAFALQQERIHAGWAPFWRYADLGLYGEQLAHLYQYVDPQRVLVLRYRTVVDDPRAAVDRACRFLGITQGLIGSIPRDNSRDFVEPGWRPKVLGPVVRTGARLGQFAPPHVWRKASAPLVAQLSGPGEAHRPLLTPEARQRLLPAFAEDIGAAQPDHRRGLRRLAVHEQPRLVRASAPGSLRWTAERHRTSVTRSCAPSGRAAST